MKGKVRVIFEDGEWDERNPNAKAWLEEALRLQGIETVAEGFGDCLILHNPNPKVLPDLVREAYVPVVATIPRTLCNATAYEILALFRAGVKDVIPEVLRHTSDKWLGDVTRAIESATS